MGLGDRPLFGELRALLGKTASLPPQQEGGLAVAFADGSGKYIKPIEWVSISGRQYVKLYAPRPRVSPYKVGHLYPTQP